VPHDDAHFSVTLPSDLIAEVMEGHFNRSMFKKRVRVVDLRMEQDMCMFSLAWIDTPKVEGTETDLEFAKRTGVPVHEANGILDDIALAALRLPNIEYEPPVRDTRGRYVKKEVSNG
jgi:hypothetical protein